jgi:hypothetical protein
VKRQFHADAPDRLWFTDITQHRARDGWVYCAAEIDAYSRRIVGWSIADHLRSELVVDALEMARWQPSSKPFTTPPTSRHDQQNNRVRRTGSGSPSGWSSLRWSLETTPSIWPRFQPWPTPRRSRKPHVRNDGGSTAASQIAVSDQLQAAARPASVGSVSTVPCGLGSRKSLTPHSAAEGDDRRVVSAARTQAECHHQRRQCL